MTNETLYIKGDKYVEVTKKDVVLSDLVQMECTNRAIVSKLKNQKLMKFMTDPKDKKKAGQ